MKKLFLVSCFIFLCSSDRSFSNDTTTASLARADKIFLQENNEDKMSMELFRQQYYFSSLAYLKRYYLKRPGKNKILEKMVETILMKTGTEAFGDINSDILELIEAPTVRIILGRRYFYEGDYEKSLKFLNQIPDEHRLAPDAYIIKSSLENKRNNAKQAIVDNKKCISVAEKLKKSAKKEQLQRYYEALQETCKINIGRIEYKAKNYKTALEIWEKIPKKSYSWPYLLLDKAWANYYLKDYNRTLGLLVTYKSPLLTSYFLPEAEMLKTLGYYRMCLWEDTEQVINQYHEVYKSESDQLRELLSKYKDSHTYFFDLVNTPVEKNEGKNLFIRNLVIQIRKKIKFSLDLNAYNWALDEYKKVHQQIASAPMKKVLLDQLREEVLYRKAKINHFAKKHMFDFLNSMYFFSQELFNVKLEILSQKRHLIYEKKNLISDRSRGSFDNINRRADQYFWNFKGAFWADELGDYSFGLQSNCKTVARKDGE